ncbi:hypothetical protein BD324DRAFT_648238 [Kockovaella imperatae]|uniref:Alpha/Beta hydrolase protein n=1 Tax=Kockovaella imperatae TaxID=4999 RepID=A0A1Y1UPU8_9TREE|nr:hypothetical protein BD324DRAFT_648238 [Kockovaella imperatae]ORX39597.1 hypothetical protein BD324DRAFT_648238 [Kockovaella imperatae]
MPPFQALTLLQHLRYPSTLSLLGLSRAFGSAAATPSNIECTRFLPRHPSPIAPRESPTPLVLIRARGLGLDESSEEREWTTWSAMFAEKGYTAVEIDISVSAKAEGGSAGASGPTGLSDPSTLPSMAKVLSGQIRLMAVPFPPIVIASGPSCLLAQTFVGDYPVSGLVMLDPPSDEAPKTLKDKSSWPMFNYEPKFPILVMADKDQVDTLGQRNRVAKAAEDGVSRGGKGVSIETMVDGIRGEKTRTEVERWMDRCGY